jgi:hypothetical protein
MIKDVAESDLQNSVVTSKKIKESDGLNSKRNLIADRDPISVTEIERVNKFPPEVLRVAKETSQILKDKGSSSGGNIAGNRVVSRAPQSSSMHDID